MINLKFTLVALMSVLAFSVGGDLTARENVFDLERLNTSHPRILLGQGGELSIAATLEVSPEMEQVHRTIIGYCDRIIGVPALTRTMEGRRMLSVSREALKRLFYLSYGYRMTGDGKYLERAREELTAVCGFEDWNPPHFLDVAEMTMGVAIAYDWLYDSLDNNTRMLVRSAIKEKAFLPSLENEYNWFLTAEHNWNQVCNAGLVYGAIAVFEDEPELSKLMIERCMQSNHLSMQGYAPDGNYAEGYNYWGYGTTFEVMLLAALDNTFGHSGDLYDYPGFSQSATYLMYMHGTSGLCFNYSDCSEKSRFHPAAFWFAVKQNDPSLLYEEKKLLSAAENLKFEEDRLLPACLIFARGMDLNAVTPPVRKLWAGGGETPVILVRTGWDNGPRDRYLGIKGGSAYINHAHMDAGSFVYDAHGMRWAMDLGMQNYHSLESKGLDIWHRGQESDRWSILRYNNYNHNTLTVNGQLHNVNGHCSVTTVYESADTLGASLDMGPVFAGQLAAAIRNIILLGEKDLCIEDRIKTRDSEALIRWSMVTPARAEISKDNDIILTQGGKAMIVRMETNIPFTTHTWSTAPTTDYDAPNPGTIIIGFEAVIPASTATTLRVRISDIE